jgi:hypothetical protein
MNRPMSWPLTKTCDSFAMDITRRYWSWMWPLLKSSTLSPPKWIPIGSVLCMSYDPLNAKVWAFIDEHWMEWRDLLETIFLAEDVVIGLSIAGVVKVWTLTGHEVRSSEPIYENESKPIRCLNAIRMTCCIYNQRTVLVVCTKYWQVLSPTTCPLLPCLLLSPNSCITCVSVLRSTTPETSRCYVQWTAVEASAGLAVTSYLLIA